MHYFDSRGVHRVYSVTLSPGTWRFWRDARGFSQRLTGTFGDGGNTITCRGQFSSDGASWNDDLGLTYRKSSRHLGRGKGPIPSPSSAVLRAE
jgi:hypothetical protein